MEHLSDLLDATTWRPYYEMKNVAVDRGVKE
jgi:hypothetical protein